jgi:hypothetical protein
MNCEPILLAEGKTILSAIKELILSVSEGNPRSNSSLFLSSELIITSFVALLLRIRNSNSLRS